MVPSKRKRQAPGDAESYEDASSTFIDVDVQEDDGGYFVETEHVVYSKESPEPDIQPITGDMYMDDIFQFDNASFQPESEFRPDNHCDNVPRKRMSQNDYLAEFAARIDEVLVAHVAREALDLSSGCQQCSEDRPTVWRCKDCVSSVPVCRRCMRNSHRLDPLHRMERWRGECWEEIESWEVGCHLVVNHCGEKGHCAELSGMLTALDTYERTRDDAEVILERSNGEGGLDEHAAGIRAAEETARNALAGSLEVPQNVPEDEYDSESDIGEEEGDKLDGPDESTARTRGAPGVDWLSNRFVTVVHINGVYRLPLVLCLCKPTTTGRSDVLKDLVFSRLFPTSLKIISTVFTQAVLEDFRLMNLECDVSAYHYYSKVRRQTDFMDPAGVRTRYHELRRMSRVWRWLSNLVLAGYTNEERNINSPRPGEFIPECPACANPKQNLPDNWREDEHPEDYTAKECIDGAFKMDHVAHASREDGVWLSEGAGMAAPRKVYNGYLDKAHNLQAKHSCQSNFRAVDLSFRGSTICDITGIVAVACARHGIFRRNSLANLYKGEQQKNADWALIQAMETASIKDLPRILVMYDIACQYYPRLEERIGPSLGDSDIVLDRAVGTFHGLAHDDDCLFRHSPAFIPGAGVVSGEALESNWSTQNKTGRATRTASLEYRSEMIDDHMGDLNWKKVLGIRQHLIHLFDRSQEMLQQSIKSFQAMEQQITPDQRARWSRELQEALDNRLINPKSMDILRAKLDGDILMEPPSDSRPGPRPGPPGRDVLSLDDALSALLYIQKLQLDVLNNIRLFAQRKRPEYEEAVTSGQSRILREWQSISQRLPNDIITLTPDIGRTVGVSPEFDLGVEDLGPIMDEDSDGGPAARGAAPRHAGQRAAVIADYDNTCPERLPLPIPSSSLNPTTAPGSAIEFELRMTQARSALQELRECISQKSLQYTNSVRKGSGNKVRTRARAVIQRLNDRVSFLSHLYRQARASMVLLRPGHAALKTFKELHREDVFTSTAVTRPNVLGLTRVRLSWIWGTGLADDHDGTPAGMVEYLRVHWMRTKMQVDRWREESRLTIKEMGWTERHFQYQERKWRALAVMSDPLSGPHAFAIRQARKWNRLLVLAQKAFDPVLKPLAGIARAD